MFRPYRAADAPPATRARALHRARSPAPPHPWFPAPADRALAHRRSPNPPGRRSGAWGECRHGFSWHGFSQFRLFTASGVITPPGDGRNDMDGFGFLIAVVT